VALRKGRPRVYGPEDVGAVIQAALTPPRELGLPSPVLAASSVGFAMGAAATDVALETADVALMQDDLPKLAEAVRLSRAAEGIIKQNVFVSLAIKGLFVVLAPFGLVALWLAVLADMGTSIAVTLNGLSHRGRRAPPARRPRRRGSRRSRAVCSSRGGCGTRARRGGS
jgi:hypothetical protein